MLAAKQTKKYFSNNIKNKEEINKFFCNKLLINQHHLKGFVKKA